MDGVTRATFCSRNAHKASELEQLCPAGRSSRSTASDWPDEVGETYYENARAKARFGREVGDPGRWMLGEDSGLEVEALGGGPGLQLGALRAGGRGPRSRAARASSEGCRCAARALRVRARRARTCRRGGPRHGHARGAHRRGAARERGLRLRPGLRPRRRGPDGRGARRRVEAAQLAPRPCSARAARGARRGARARRRGLRWQIRGWRTACSAALLRRQPAGARSSARVFPHKPGTDPLRRSTPGGAAAKPLQATCSTDVSLVKPDRAVVTLTETWNHGGQAHTWFFFIRRSGEVDSVVEEGAAAPQAQQSSPRAAVPATS